MGIASVLALILVVLKATGLTSMAWGWCLLGFGVDVLLFVGVVTAGFFFSKKVTKNISSTLDSSGLRARLDAAKDRLG